MQTGDVITLRVERLSYNGGRGVGRFEGCVVFVADTAPNELIEAKITAVKKNFAEAELTRVIESSAARRVPPCPVFGRCGGCSWQHISYDEQVRQKEAFLRHSLARALRQFGGESESIKLQMAEAPEEFRYRNRVQVHVESGEFGFYARKSRELVPITDCLITEAALLEGFHPEASGDFEISFDGSNRRMIRELDERGPAFAQVNFAQNAVLQNTVIDYVEQVEKAPSCVIDFYCGDGNLSLPLLKKFESMQVLGVELSKPAVARAVESSKRLGFDSRAEFVSGDVVKFLKKLGQDDAEEAIFVFDPPRAGLGRALVEETTRLSSCVRAVILVSCDLASFERDIGLLSHAFQLKSVTGIDMFPQTDYIEAVSLFLPRAAQNA